MSKQLRIASNLTLPLDFVTQTQAILAMRRRGKTYTASVQAEELLKAGQQIVVIDVTGAWWGLKSSADGKSKGFDIVVAGGEHADIPLNPDAGELLAQAIIADRFSCILDLSLLRKGARLKFLAAFLDTFHTSNRAPVHVFADEADDYVPQTIMWREDESTKCLGAMDDLVRRGGIHGIGCTLITQRPAVINNNVLTQCQVLTVLRITHPADIKPIQAWVKVHATKEEEEQVLAELPRLPLGGAFFWSPGWPEDHPIGVKRVQVRERETFNSSRTPKPGEKVQQPKVLARPDLEKLGERIRQLAEEAKAKDPKLLQRKVAELARENAKLAAAAAAGKPTAAKGEARRVEVPVVKDAQIQRLEQLTKKLDGMLPKLGAELVAVEKRVGDLKQLGDLIADQSTEISGAINVSRAPTNLPAPAKSPAAAGKPPRFISRPITQRPIAASASINDAETGNGDFHPSSSQVRILNAIAWFESLGVTSPTRLAVGFIARMKPTGGHFQRVIGPLSTHGLISARGDGSVQLTEAGRALSSPPDVPPTLEAYHTAISAVLANGSQRNILDAIIAAGGAELTPAEVGQAANIDHEGGHFQRSIGPLSTLGLIERRGGKIYPTELLFPPSLV
jgi:hypothetical protein